MKKAKGNQPSHRPLDRNGESTFNYYSFICYLAILLIVVIIVAVIIIIIVDFMWGFAFNDTRAWPFYQFFKRTLCR